MERAEKPLPLDNNVLGELAHRAGAYAKALYYFVCASNNFLILFFLIHGLTPVQEKEYREAPRLRQTQFHNLINVNDKLGQHEAGNGLLKKAKGLASVGEIPIVWYEKIHNWSEVCFRKCRIWKTHVQIRY